MQISRLANESSSDQLRQCPLADGDYDVSSALWIESHPVITVRIDSLVFEDSPRLGGEDLEHIRMLAESGDTLPPILVHRPTMRVIDGVHRVRAALLNSIEEIRARILDCDETAAFVLAVRANVTHGLPLSQSDRVAAAVRIITYRPEWSDRAVAAVTGLSDKTVSRIRGRSTAETSQSNARLGRDGRIRPLDTGASRQQAAEMINEKPEVGLREVARATGLSVATVRDVRQRIGRGEDPVPGRYRAAALESSAATESRPHQALESGLKRKDVFADRHILLAKLTQDPSLRFSETGRQIVRWLHQHTVDADGMESLVGGLPDHWAPVVASLARGCARTWLRIAEQLEQRAESAVCGRQ